MYKLTSPLAFRTALLLLSIILCLPTDAWAQTEQGVEVILKQKGDPLQTAVDEQTETIDGYYQLNKQAGYTSDEVKSIEKEIALHTREIEKSKKGIKRLEDQLATANGAQAELKKTISKQKQVYVVAGKTVQAAFAKLEGGHSIQYKGIELTVFVADLSKHDVEMHMRVIRGGPYSLELKEVKARLERGEKEVLMLTNGGMYTPKHKPEGLLIRNGEELAPIDTATKPNLNFYMKPNGVFYIDKEGRAHIVTTKAYLKKVKADTTFMPLQATQSGPMLVIDGKHHPRFNHGSSSRKLRSGVGVLKNGKVVFIISEKNSPTNFHDFATVFKDLAGCDDALFLDGVISKMYIKDPPRQELGGDFGPVISVTKK